MTLGLELWAYGVAAAVLAGTIWGLLAWAHAELRGWLLQSRDRDARSVADTREPPRHLHPVA